MPFVLLPTWRADSITDITADFLKQQDVKLLMLDFDNTIVPYTTDIPTQQVQLWLSQMVHSGIRVCVVSNSRKERVPVFCKENGLDCITHARKPFPDGIRRCLRQFGVPGDKAVLVGDQIFTDTLGGNFAGVRTVLVKAIDNHNIWLKLRHVAELPFIAVSKNRRIIK